MTARTGNDGSDDRGGDSEVSATVVETITAARETIPARERQRAYGAACGIAALAMLDAIENPSRGGPTTEAVRAFLRGATANRLAVLLERIGARDAHGIVQGLSRAGLIEPGVAQVAHARIDLRPSPAPAAG